MKRLLACLFLFAAAASAGAGSEPRALEAAAVFPLTDVVPGLRGYGLSVFSGREPQRFEVEVIGVLREALPQLSYIVVRLSGQGLEETGVIAGMSGSPVYLDGRIAGAVSASWAFVRGATGLVTPIEAMRALPVSATSARPLMTLPTLAALAAGRGEPQAFATALAALGAGTSSALGAPRGLDWAAGGFAPTTLARLGHALGEVGGIGAGAAAAEPRAGGALAAVLIDGDLRLAATGTITERRGDELLAFGHPLFGLGAVAVPMATSEIVTVVSSAYSSFKLANLGQVVGTIEGDHLPGIRGRLGRLAPQVPMVVRMMGAVPRTFTFRLANLPELTPALATFALLGALDAAASTAATRSLDLELELDLGARGRLALAQSFDGDGAIGDLANWLVGLTAYLALNPLEAAPVRAIAATVAARSEPNEARVIGLRAMSAVVRPGERLEVEVELDPYRAAPERHRLSLDLPADLPAGRLVVLVGDGSSVDAARLELESFEPRRLDSVLTWLRGLSSRRELVAVAIAPGRGLAAPGEVSPRLPGSIALLRGTAASRGERPLRAAVVARQAVASERPLAGLARIEVEVRRTAVTKEAP